jgi:hypothetical protein
MISCLEMKAMAQTSSAECMGYTLGTLIGVLINPRANTSGAIPAHCRGEADTQYMRQPSSSQRYNRQDADVYIRQQELRNRRLQREADSNLESIRDSNCLASSEGC